MPTKLSKRPEQLVRDFLAEAIRPSEIHGYDPQQTDQTANDWLPITTNWSKYGDTYPVIVVTETEGPSLPNSGTTNFNGQQGDGSGPNQYTVFNVTVSTQAVELENDSAYLDGVEADDLTHDLYQECRNRIQNNATTAVDEALATGLTPGTQTRSSEETDSGSTLTWIQRQGSCNTNVLLTP